MYSLALHEQKQHGTPEFPAEYHYVDCSHPRYQMPFHWHREWELLHIIEGSFRLHIEDDEYLAQAGDVLLVNGGALHGGMPTDCTYECLVFDLRGLFRGIEIAKKDLRPFYQQTLIPNRFISSAGEPAFCRMVEAYMCALRSGQYRELETIGFLCRFFAMIHKERLYVRVQDSKLTPANRIHQIKSVLEYIETHYSDPLQLESMARIANMNPKYFCRVFHSIIGRSPMDYVNYYRIERAAYLLINSSLPVTTVGLECGFSEASYFTKVFQKYKNITPKQYRVLNEA
ncbi:MAG: AraC family transcriptional regulator [Ruminococcaceae bacterium]|nr:AraC family transcriptional regulator [Oscillospiraceae bacterium]